MVTVHSGTVLGVDGVPVEVEVDLLQRLPCMVIVGLPNGAVRESGDRVRSAMQAAGFDFPKRRVVVNLAPADLRKNGTAFDLPIAVGTLCADKNLPRTHLDDTYFFGELSLEGQVRRVRGTISLCRMARDRGAKRVVVPAENASEAAVVEDIEVLSAETLEAVCRWLDGTGTLPVGRMATIEQPEGDLDLCEVRGQARARRALEVAAAGGHNLLMVGAPGCGKLLSEGGPAAGCACLS